MTLVKKRIRSVCMARAGTSVSGSKKGDSMSQLRRLPGPYG
jgi:hypothetical protein